MKFSLDNNQIIDYVRYNFNAKEGDERVFRCDFIKRNIEYELATRLTQKLKILNYNLKTYEKILRKFRPCLNNTIKVDFMQYSFNNTFIDINYAIELGKFSPINDYVENSPVNSSKNSQFYTNHFIRSNDSLLEKDLTKINKLIFQSEKMDRLLTKEYSEAKRYSHILYSLLRGRHLYEIDKRFDKDDFYIIKTLMMQYIKVLDLN